MIRKERRKHWPASRRLWINGGQIIFVYIAQNHDRIASNQVPPVESGRTKQKEFEQGIKKDGRNIRESHRGGSLTCNICHVYTLQISLTWTEIRPRATSASPSLRYPFLSHAIIFTGVSPNAPKRFVAVLILSSDPNQRPVINERLWGLWAPNSSDLVFDVKMLLEIKTRHTWSRFACRVMTLAPDALVPFQTAFLLCPYFTLPVY